MSRAFFIYWELPRGRVAQACDAVRAFQAGWRERGVHAALHERADDRADLTTLMETYAAEGGLAAHLEQALIAESAAALAHWAEGPRHVEVFKRC